MARFQKLIFLLVLTVPAAAETLVYLGTYTGGESKGIYRSTLDETTGELSDPVLAAELENPSFLVVSPDQNYLFAVSENGNFKGEEGGGVSSFAIGEDGGLTLISQVNSGGGAPCHISTDPQGKCLLVANYMGGSISSYQIKVDQIELQGEGALLKLIEQRKKKLQAEGYFNEEHKKPIPFIPDKIGIITSPTGAVIMDIINRVKDRYPTHLLIYPISVQGNKSAGEIIQGIEFFNKKINVDTIIIARGGGGVEDLISFNDENVVKAAFVSKIPIISAIGHETDFTLLDFVADYRASTPTAAAEKAVPEKNNLTEKIFALQKQLISGFNLFLKEKDKNIYQLVKSLNINNLLMLCLMTH